MTEEITSNYAYKYDLLRTYPLELILAVAKPVRRFGVG